MDVIYGLIPFMLFLGVVSVVIFIWMARSGYFDDLDGAAHSIFMDDDIEEEHARKQAQQQEQAGKQDISVSGEEKATESDTKKA